MVQLLGCHCLGGVLDDHIWFDLFGDRYHASLYRLQSVLGTDSEFVKVKECDRSSSEEYFSMVREPSWMPKSTKCNTLVGMASAEKGSTVRRGRMGRMGILFALVISIGELCTGDDT